MLMQRAPLQYPGGHHRHFSLQQLLRKCMLFQHLRFAPATGPVELGHHLVTALLRRIQTGLIHTVFIRAQRLKTPIGPQIYAAERIQHAIRGQCVIGVRGRRRGSIHKQALCAWRHCAAHPPIKKGCRSTLGYAGKASLLKPPWQPLQGPLPVEARSGHPALHSGAACPRPFPSAKPPRSPRHCR